MIITMFRSSSYNRYEFCPMAFYSEYCLGWTDKSGKAASKGTCVHKIMEILANTKHELQIGNESFDDEIVGKIFVDNLYDDSLISSLIEDVYLYYSTKHIHLQWTNADFRDVKNWTWRALHYNNGEFDPRNQDIVEAEPKFNFEIEEPWATYSYTLGGKELSGFLKLKGSIDLVVRENENTLHIIDYKTGAKPYDWNTDKDKTQADFFVDPQVRLYHLACKRLFPETKNFLVTVYYIRTDNPFTICLTDNDLAKTMDMVKERFLEIKECKEPRLKRSWKCSKLCSQRHTFEGTNIEPKEEFRSGCIASQGETMTMCDQINFEIKRRGIDWATENMANPDFVIGFYQEPGK